MIDIFIPIQPRPQERPRHRIIQAKAGNRAFTTTYDPKTSKDYKATIAKHAKDKGVKPFAKDVPLLLKLVFYMEKPKSSKRVFPTVRPDLDNLEKAVKDALNGVAWSDDCQVCRVTKEKVYASMPGIWLNVIEIKE